MDDSWENGGDDERGEVDDGRTKGGISGLAGVVDPNGPGWEATCEAAFNTAWKEHHKPGTPPAVYKADIYVKGENPISGYRVVLSP